MCGSAVMPNDSFSALCLMILTSRCGNPAAILTPFPLSAIPKQMKSQQRAGSKPGLGRIQARLRQAWLAAGPRIQHPGQDAEPRWDPGFPVSHSLAHACGSHGFPTSSSRENSPLWTQLKECKGRMQCPAVIKNAFLLARGAGAKGSVL